MHFLIRHADFRENRPVTLCVSMPPDKVQNFFAKTCKCHKKAVILHCFFVDPNAGSEPTYQHGDAVCRAAATIRKRYAAIR